MTRKKVTPAKIKPDLSLYGNFVNKRPEYRYEVIGKKTLLGRLGLARPGRGWDIIGFRKIKDD